MANRVLTFVDALCIKFMFVGTPGRIVDNTLPSETNIGVHLPPSRWLLFHKFENAFKKLSLTDEALSSARPLSPFPSVSHSRTTDCRPRLSCASRVESLPFELAESWDGGVVVTNDEGLGSRGRFEGTES